MRMLFYGGISAYVLASAALLSYTAYRTAFAESGTTTIATSTFRLNITGHNTSPSETLSATGTTAVGMLDTHSETSNNTMQKAAASDRDGVSIIPNASAPRTLISETAAPTVPDAPIVLPPNERPPQGEPQKYEPGTSVIAPSGRAVFDELQRRSAQRAAQKNDPENTTTTPDAQKPAEHLEEIGKTLQKINIEKKAVAETVRSVVGKKAGETAPSPRIEEAAREAAERITDTLEQTLSPIEEIPQRRNVGPAIRTSLGELAAIIEEESGSPVNIESGSRQIAQTVERASEAIAAEQEVLQQKGGLDMYRDSDNDGVSDFDERNVYHTDPYHAYTAGSRLTDGERILLGLDAHSTSTEPVPVESPKEAGAEVARVFEVHEIALVSAQSATGSVSDASAPEFGADALPSAPDTAIRISGRALPNSFVTLYIFSTPIVVTVKTDVNGSWSYTLDKELPDGKHELYIATVNEAGKILAKSPPVPFVKRAEALEFTPLSLPPITDVSPLDTLREHLVVTGGIVVLLFSLVALVAFGAWRRLKTGPDDMTPSAA